MDSRKRWAWALLLSGACAGAACTTADPPADEAPDATAPGDAAPDATADTSTDAAADTAADTSADATADASTDAAADTTADGSTDAAADTAADTSTDATADASTDATADASDASTDAGGPPALLAPGENDAPYEMRAVCTVAPTSRVGTASSCCRAASYTTETVCDTALHEERDASGALTLRIDPMTACTQTSTAGTCTRSGTLARCDAAGLTCPTSGSTAGAPSLVVGTYARRMMAIGGAPTPKDQYWLGCSTAPMITQTAPSCTPPPAPQSTQRTATVVRTAPGTFAVRRSWATIAPPGFCATPSLLPAADTMGSSTFVDGNAPMGGTFATTGHTCTYTLTKK